MAGLCAVLDACPEALVAMSGSKSFGLYRDRAGVIHEVTEVIAREGINIASLYCSRKQRGKDAFMEIDIDSPLSDAALEAILSLADMVEGRYLDRIP